MQLTLARLCGPKTVRAVRLHPLFAWYRRHGDLIHIPTGYAVNPRANTPLPSEKVARRIMRALLKEYPADMWTFTKLQDRPPFPDGVRIIQAVLDEQS